MQRYFIKIAYDGSDFFGWQTQPNEVNIQDVLNKALCLILKTSDIKLVGCGRTDSGVHASCFYAHFDLQDTIEGMGKIVFKLNNFLPNSISVSKIIPVMDEAHARFDASARTYKYFIHQKKNPFLNKYSLLYLRKLDVMKMNLACKILLKHSDFASFSKLGSDNKSTKCSIKEAEWEFNTTQLIFTISADRFLRNMVRAIVGTLLDVGLNKISLLEFESIIKSSSRQNASASAPAHALFLSDIKYDYISA